MAHVTHISMFAGLALVGLVATAALPLGVHASSAHVAPPFKHDTVVGTHPVAYNDAFSAPGQFVKDQQLGKKTHWEGNLNLSDPASSLVWTRVVDASPTGVSGGVSGVRPATGSYSSPQIRPRISSGTCGNGGVKLYQNLNFSGGDCIAFYGSGSQDLHILYPGCAVFCSHVNDSVSALSTAGSAGSGTLACGNGVWQMPGYEPGTNYPDLRQGRPGQYGCYHNASVIYNN